MSKIWGFLVLGFVFSFIGCAAPSSQEGEENAPKSVDEMRGEALKNIDREECAARGGTVRQEGMLGLPRCVIPYADAGAICSDSSECEGKCLGSDDVTDYHAPRGEMKGRCEADDSPFGCYAEIEKGSAGAALCVD